MDYNIDYKDENVFKDVMKQLEAGISVYKKMLDQYPCMQFLTTFCRELPHLYGQSLLNQTYIKPLVCNKKNITNTFDADGEPVCELYQLTQAAKEIFSQIFDNYAKTTIKTEMKNSDDDKKVNVDNHTLYEKVMSLEDFTNYIYSCALRYVLYTVMTI